jgi:hypothetical protein
VNRSLRRTVASDDACDIAFVSTLIQERFWFLAFLFVRPTGSRAAPRYGRGPSELEAKRSAVRRWIVEEEGLDLRRRPGDPLP